MRDRLISQPASQPLPRRAGAAEETLTQASKLHHYGIPKRGAHEETQARPGDDADEHTDTCRKAQSPSQGRWPLELRLRMFAC